MNKQQKAALYEENQKYIALIVTMFLRKYQTFLYMKEDMIQECAMKFLTICDKFNPNMECKFSTFLHSQLYFYLQKMIKKETKCKVAEQGFVEESDWDEAYDPYAFDNLLRFGYLTEHQQDILRLRYIVGLTCREAGLELGISHNAVHLAEHRALDQLRLSQ